MITLEVINVQQIEKRIVPDHGPTSLYQQILGGGSPKPNLAKSLKLWVMTIKPGGDNRRHAHENIEQAYLILEGGGIVEVGEERRRVKAWDVIYLPPKVAHAFYNDTEKPCVIIGIGANV